ncbi:hypothetical protein [Mycobacterium intracellulare]|uniref:hypothetical protein n=1 Tax=Mycobacterium intracellulare TaxID=1767 RepID=UPI00115BD891|nr:hypothetical protein [Mycobacterium intracellulare]
MGWEYSAGNRGSDWHEGYLIAEFENNDQALTVLGSGIPPGHLAVERYEDGSFRTRPAGEVTGWRVRCNCYHAGDAMPSHVWISGHRWTRVASPVQHNPSAFRIYTTDAPSDILDVAAGDTHTAAYDVWWREHINDIDAEAAIEAAIAAIRAGEQQLDKAVLDARHRQLSWAKIGAAAQMSAQAAHERWADLARRHASP